MARPPLYVGQIVYWVPFLREKDACEVAVASIGRKYAELKFKTRIDKNTWCTEEGAKPEGCIYYSEEEYKEAKAARLTVQRLVAGLQYIQIHNSNLRNAVFMEYCNKMIEMLEDE